MKFNFCRMSTSENCIFCKIVDGRIPSEKVYEDEQVCAFKDINPAAPMHLLIIPNKHIQPLSANGEDGEVLGRMLLLAPKLAERSGVSDSGYRLVINQGADAGQEVFHLHMHLLGGHKLAGLGG